MEGREVEGLTVLPFGLITNYLRRTREDKHLNICPQTSLKDDGNSYESTFYRQGQLGGRQGTAHREHLC